eukprot:m.119440 g.119440  ORF g.119440 m.119440 type:complete len:59 (-) comp13676_c1_seq7:4083-4259(-)
MGAVHLNIVCSRVNVCAEGCRWRGRENAGYMKVNRFTSMTSETRQTILNPHVACLSSD